MSQNKYKKEYYKILGQGNMHNVYPNLTGSYKLDKKTWKNIVDSRENNDAETTDGTVCYIKPTLENEEFLMNYLRGHSPSGCEFKGQDIWKAYVEKFGALTETDSHGNCVASIRTKVTGKGKPLSVMIEAHCDEISYIITKIDSNGLIYVMRNGGSDEAIAPSKKVLIHINDYHTVPAVFGWIAIHIRESSIKPDRNSIFLDAGFNNSDEVRRAGIEVGQYVTYDEEPVILNDKVIGKSLDNKVGGYIIAEVMRKLINTDLGFDLYASNSVQEEVGLHGAEMVASSYKPDLVIVTDVCHDTSTPGITNKLIGDIQIGKGPVLVRGAAINSRFNKVAESLGHEHQIMACSGRGTGTDADAFTYANGGTPTILIKMPLRYMHTTVEMVSIRDINNAIDLMYSTLISLDANPINTNLLLHKANTFSNE